jgi:long-chain fatty acid transport protein
VRFNFGLSVPAGFGTDWGKSWAGRYLSQESKLFFVSLTPSLSFRVTEWLSVSAGLPITYSKSENKVAVANLEPGAEDGRAKLDVDGTSAGVQLSFLLEPTPTTRFGFSWRSESEPEMDGKPKFSGLGPILSAALEASGLIDEKIKLKMRVPQSIQFGFYQELFDDWLIMGDVAWVDWSRFGKIDLKIAGNKTTLETNYDDIWVGSVATEYRISDLTKAGVGFSYVSSAVRNKHRTLSLPMDEMFVIGVGGFHQFLPDFGVQANFMVLLGGDGKIDQEGPGGRVVGKYDRRRSYILQIGLVWGNATPRPR